jgi:hypothetical protein
MASGRIDWSGPGLEYGFAVGLGRVGELGVADGGAVASPVDGVHDRESAAYSEDEAHKKSDDGRPVEGHDVSLLRHPRTFDLDALPWG